MEKIGKGSIPLRIGNLINTSVYGGPYLEFPMWRADMFGVKMAVEIEAGHDVDIPTEDFNVPKVSDLRAGIVKALMAMINGKKVYAGCMGGIGRTGIFLAALAKVQIEYRKTKHRGGRGEDPVLYVRKHFTPHAVETKQQMEYIERLDVTDIVMWLEATQTAMGLGGFTPPNRVGGDGDAMLRRALFTDLSLDEHDNHRADWKERYRDQTTAAYYAETDSAYEVTAEQVQLLVNESLQSQIDELQEQVDLLQQRSDLFPDNLHISGGRAGVEALVPAQNNLDQAEILRKADVAVKDLLLESRLTKQTWRESVSQYFERIANYHF